MSKEAKKFLEVTQLISRDFYDYYRENRTEVAKEIDQYKYFAKAISGLLRLIKKESHDREFGVYIEKFGYFCVIKTRKSRKFNFKKSPLEKSKRAHGYLYWFIPEEKNKDWYLESDKQISLKTKHTVDLEAVRLLLEVNNFNNRLIYEAKDIKYIK